MTRVEIAVSEFEMGYTCSQSILSTYGTDFGIEPEVALKLACPFGGGMGRLGETCGAVTGAFMALGLKFGCVEADDVDGWEMTVAFVGEFADRFIERHQTIRCRDLIGYDLDTPEGLRSARESEVFRKICPAFIRSAAEILEQML